MTLSQQLRDCIERFEFREAFTGPLGWNPSARTPLTRMVAGRNLLFTPLAEMGGFVVLEVTEPQPAADAPGLTAPSTRGVRMSAGRSLAGEMQNRVLVFVENARQEAIWLMIGAVRGKTAERERRYYPGVPVEPLVRMLRGFHVPWSLLDDMGDIEHTKMLDIFGESGALAEKVTKKFYNLFDKQRKAFEPFLAWIDDERNRAWYITALLNRLMFIYFIQHKGLLGGDAAYLTHRLTESEARGKDRFYRDFFLPLCFFGFGRKAGERGRFEQQFACLPYLDGGLFQLHEVEKEAGISAEAVAEGLLPTHALIPDAEFRKWFAFFDDWNWTLDETHVENDRQIDPAILGYIFEKYINQKQMGAYYTKEDITEYICRNTILPRLFDMLAATGDNGKQAVEPLPIGPHPNLLNIGRGISHGEGIDRYIYDAVKTTEYLPTETDREYDARQKRYHELLQAHDDGAIRTVNDFITYNLDIVKMARDFVETIQDPEVLRALYFECLRRITVLDPTCGSGAFLFAALKILAPLYEACLDRMAALLSDGVAGACATVFEGEVARIREHPNREYYILKTIVVSNLYGVDIMEEAVEICKLRLFLQLVGHADPDPAKPNLGIEPLPDIDFNIRCGNTLVGYTSIEDIDRQWDLCGRLAFEKDHGRLRMVLGEYGRLLRMFRDRQLGLPTPRVVTKQDILDAVEAVGVRDELNKDLWRLYRASMKLRDSVTQRAFEETHRPCHWVLEFPAVMAAGGFDVLVGNPPFVETSEIRGLYSVLGYATEPCGNLFAYVFERALSVCFASGRGCLILPISSVATPRMAPLVEHIGRARRCVHAAHFAVRPGKLFDGVDMNISILNTGPSASTAWRTTGYTRWPSGNRGALFQSLHYVALDDAPIAAPVPKPASLADAALRSRLSALKRLAQFLDRPGGSTVYVHSGGRYFRKCLLQQLSNEYKPYIVPGASVFQAVALLSSSLFYWWWIMHSDTFHVTKGDVEAFPVSEAALQDAQLGILGEALLADLWKHAQRRLRTRKDGSVQTEVNFRVGKSRDELALIDSRLAMLYALSADEAAQVASFDAKYRYSSDED